MSQGAKRPVKEILGRIPAKYLTDLEDNTRLKACCRKAKNHQVELFKTHEEAEGADMMVMECTCGRKHYRAAAGRGDVKV